MVYIKSQSFVESKVSTLESVLKVSYPGALEHEHIHTRTHSQRISLL